MNEVYTLQMWDLMWSQEKNLPSFWVSLGKFFHQNQSHLSEISTTRKQKMRREKPFTYVCVKLYSFGVKKKIAYFLRISFMVDGRRILASNRDNGFAMKLNKYLKFQCLSFINIIFIHALFYLKTK